MAGGNGGSGLGGAGGSGGANNTSQNTDATGGVGDPGTPSAQGSGGGGGGGAGLKGGGGGNGGSASGGTIPNTTGTGSSTYGGNGLSGSNEGDGGGGGGGGAQGVPPNTIDIRDRLEVRGGNGGQGGDGVGGGGGGGGGAGGYGLVADASISGRNIYLNVSDNGGGRGGDGGSGFKGGAGGSGGVGLLVAGSGNTIYLGNGILSGGDGGVGGAADDGSTGANGSGGVGIVLEQGSQTIYANGTISGGLSGDGVTRAASLIIGGGANKIYLGFSTRFIGDIALSGSSDIYAGIGSIIESSIKDFNSAASIVFHNDITLTGVNSYTGETNVAGGTLQLGNGGATGSLSNQTIVTLNFSALAINRNNAVTIGSTIRGDGDVRQIGSGVTTLTAANTYSGGTTISGGTLAVAADGNLGAAPGGLTFGGGTLEITATGFTSARDVTLNTAGTVQVDTGNATLSGIIANGTGGAGSLAKAGAGTLTLSGPNTYTGGTTINGGVLAVTGGNALANTGAVVLANVAGAQLSVINSETIGSLSGGGMNGGNVVISGGQTLTVNQITAGTFAGEISGLTGNLVKQGAGTLTLINNNPYQGTTTISEGTLQVGNGGTTGQIATGVRNVINNAVLAFNRSNDTAYGGQISGSGSLEKLGAGVLTLGNNSYTGATLVSDGILSIRLNNGLGEASAGTTVADGATLRIEENLTTAEALTISGAGGASNRGALQNSVFNYSNSTVTGSVTLAADARINSDRGTLLLTGGISGNPSGSVLTLGGTGNGEVRTVGVSATIGGVVKDGTGNWTLSAANTYTGATTINGGTLLVNGSLAAGSAVTVENTALLGGTGTIGGTVGVNLGGTLTGGTVGTVGELNTGSLTLAAGSNFRQDVTSLTTADLIDVTGTVTLGGTLDLRFDAGFTSRSGDSFVFIRNDAAANQPIDAVSGKFSAVEVGGLNVALSTSDTFSFNQHTYQIDYAAGDGNDVALRDVTFVPGPPTQPTNPTTPTEPTQPTGPSADALMKFGMIVTDPASQAGQVYGLYEALLNRAPDPLGLESFTTALQNGASLEQVANALLASPERGMGVTDPSAFVQSLYQNLLNRPADASGLATFTNELADGVSPATVAVQLATSAEAQSVLAPTFSQGVFVPDASEASVARLYYGLLGRAPDAGGLAAFSNFIETSGSAAGEMARLGQVAETIIMSNEFMTGRPNSTDLAFVNGLYSGALGRAPDAGGAAFYQNELAQGVSRATVALQIAESPEAQVHLVGQIEQGALLVA